MKNFKTALMVYFVIVSSLALPAAALAQTSDDAPPLTQDTPVANDPDMAIAQVPGRGRLCFVFTMSQVLSPPSTDASRREYECRCTFELGSERNRTFGQH